MVLVYADRVLEKSMSVQWEPGDLNRFYRREQQLTHSQTIARRGLKALLLAALTAAAIWWLTWGPK